MLSFGSRQRLSDRVVLPWTLVDEGFGGSYAVAVPRRQRLGTITV